MSDEKDTAVSPEAAEQPVDKTVEGKEKNLPRPKDYIFLNHMMRSARSGLKRHVRSGNRRQGVILDNGQRLRRRGTRLMNEVNLRTLVECHHRLLGYLEAGIIEAIDPNTQKVMTIEQVIAKIEEVGSRTLPGEEKMKVEHKPESTRPDMKAMEELAQTPEATGKEEVAEEILEEELLKLSRSDLNGTALKYGVEDSESYRTKQDVVDAIFEAQSGEED